MKLCDITHFYTTKSGGVKTYLLKKVEYIGKNNLNEVEHFLILPSDKSKIERGEKSQFYFVKSPETFFWKPYRAIINKNEVKNIIFSKKPNIVELGSPYILPTWIKEFRQQLGYKIIGFYHSHIEATLLSALGIKTEKEYQKRLIRHYIRKTYSDMDIVLTPSQYMARYLKQIGIENAQALPLGVDVDTFTIGKKDLSFRKMHNIGEDKIILLFVGRFSKEKKIQHLIEVLGILNYRYPGKYHLVLVGGGPEEEKIKGMNLDNATILPYCSDKDKLTNIYNSSDIFVTASDSETFGLCLLEAQSCGLPVVAFKNTSIPEVVFKQEFLARDRDDFADKIKFVSHILCEGLKNETREFVIRNFSWNKTFEKLFCIYQDILKGNNHPVGKFSTYHIRPSYIARSLWKESPLTLRRNIQKENAHT